MVLQVAMMIIVVYMKYNWDQSVWRFGWNFVAVNWNQNFSVTHYAMGSKRSCAPFWKVWKIQIPSLHRSSNSKSDYIPEDYTHHACFVAKHESLRQTIKAQEKVLEKIQNQNHQQQEASDERVELPEASATDRQSQEQELCHWAKEKELAQVKAENEQFQHDIEALKKEVQRLKNEQLQLNNEALQKEVQSLKKRKKKCIIM